MYSSVPITQQIPVYFKKFARINIRESAWKFALFAGIIAVIIGAIVGQLNHSGVFVTVSGCIWLGIFNTIQSVCKEHDIINSEYRQGMNIGAYVIAQVLWQAVLCFVQAFRKIHAGFFHPCQNIVGRSIEDPPERLYRLQPLYSCEIGHPGNAAADSRLITDRNPVFRRQRTEFRTEVCKHLLIGCNDMFPGLQGS